MVLGVVRGRKKTPAWHIVCRLRPRGQWRASVIVECRSGGEQLAATRRQFCSRGVLEGNRWPRNMTAGSTSLAGRNGGKQISPSQAPRGITALRSATRKATKQDRAAAIVPHRSGRRLKSKERRLQFRIAQRAKHMHEAYATWQSLFRNRADTKKTPAALVVTPSGGIATNTTGADQYPPQLTEMPPGSTETATGKQVYAVETHVRPGSDATGAIWWLPKMGKRKEKARR
jgi:hypothetical protein